MYVSYLRCLKTNRGANRLQLNCSRCNSQSDDTHLTFRNEVIDPADDVLEVSPELLTVAVLTIERYVSRRDERSIMWYANVRSWARDNQIELFRVYKTVDCT